VISGNSAASHGGGAYKGRFHHCTLADNVAGWWGGGAYQSVLHDSDLVRNVSTANGGGAYQGTLSNCLIAGNSSTGSSGGGTLGGWLYNCILSGNTAPVGGGSSGGVLRNCLLITNSANWGGGSSQGELYNCTLFANSARQGGGGAHSGLHRNGLLWYNTAPGGANWNGGSLSFSCTTPIPPGDGNLSRDPLMASASHLAAASPCIGRGSSAYADGLDIDGEPWTTYPAMGCDEHSGPVTGDLAVAMFPSYTNFAVGFPVELLADIEGRPAASWWDLGAEGVISNRPLLAHAWSSTGNYAITLTAVNASHPGGISATVMVSVVLPPTHYVNPLSTSAIPPHTSWQTAATNIQAAVDAATLPGAIILVTNGTYDAGSRVVHGAMANRLAIDKPLLVRSVNGPAFTAIRGQGPVGTGAVRCAYVGKNASLVGFCLTNGATRSTGDELTERCGGGAWCDEGAMLSNCVITASSASSAGGGVVQGALYDCTLSGNIAGSGAGGALASSLTRCVLSNNVGTFGSGAVYGSTLYRCILTRNSGRQGGAAASSTLRDCVLTDNSASEDGGGTAQSTLYNCLLVGNSAGDSGGGSLQSYHYNCTIVSNRALSGGGTLQGWAYNSIVYHNGGGNNQGGAFQYCCTTPIALGAGNFDEPPLFRDAVAGDYRLQVSSPCIDAGTYQDWMAPSDDLEGNPRVLNGAVDVGAYELAFRTHARVLLEGPYQPGPHAMTTALLDGGILPLTPAYHGNHAQARTLPSNTTDWVLIELHDSNRVTQASQVGLLRNDGVVQPVGGGTGVVVEASPGEALFLVVKHRNHPAVMSAQPLVFTNVLTTHDFTIGPTTTYDATNTLIEVEPGVWAMIAGDADGDGRITEIDRQIVTQQLGKTGYLAGDLNLDGVVDDSD